MGIRILLVDGQRLFREGLRALLRDEPAMEVVGEADDGRAAVELANNLSPDVILMDVTMPDLNGVLATRQILSACPRAKVIALSMQSDRRYVFEMLRAGASAYVLKTCGLDELVRAINLVVTGQKYLSPDITGKVVEDYVRGALVPDTLTCPILSTREQEVLQLLAEGKTSKEVASLLHVSVKTIATHRQNIMDKLGLRSVAELTKYAIREGLTTLET